MAALKQYFHNLSLRRSIVCYILAFALLAFLLSLLTSVSCFTVREAIYAQYPPSGEKYYLTTASGQQLGEGTYISTTSVSYSLQHKRLLLLLEWLPNLAIPLYTSLCLLAAILLFYRNKLQMPLYLLEQAAQQISENNLDFTIQYENADELGHLCHSFETMRAALSQNYNQMWRQVEQRKQLNAAFAHDLRTPLTILKGYNQMLQESDQAQTQVTASVMERQLTRLERYVDTMNQLQKLEDYIPCCRPISLEKSSTLWQQSALLYCQRQQKALQWQNHCSTASITLDTELITQVLENLLSNAARYARTKIIVTLQDSWQMNNSQALWGLLLVVADDGPGFSPKSLQNATIPYYTEQKQHGQHYGLGLTICQCLCHCHGGWLHISNTEQGAQVTAFFAAEKQ